jgi:hypothetical protein
MARGAQLGLSARAQDQAAQNRASEERSAADRLTLAYNQLESQERRAAEAVQARRELAKENAKARSEQAAAALLQRGQAANMLNQYRQDSLAQRADALGSRPDPTGRLFHVGNQLVDSSGNVIFDSTEKLNEAARAKAAASGVVSVKTPTENATRKVPADTFDEWMRATLNPGTTTNSIPARSGLNLGPLGTWGAKPASQTVTTNAPPTLNQFLATNRLPPAPTLGTNAPAAALPAPPTGTARVRSPNGKTGTIPRSQLADAIAQGYTEIK